MSEVKTIATIRKGSSVTYWKPDGILEGLLETNPDSPPRIHYLDGRGTVELVPVQVPIYPKPRHEHMPLIPGQEYPRDIAPIVDRTVTETRWMIPEVKVMSDAIDIGIGIMRDGERIDPLDFYRTRTTYDTLHD